MEVRKTASIMEAVGGGGSTLTDRFPGDQGSGQGFTGLLEQLTCKGLPHIARAKTHPS